MNLKRLSDGKVVSLIKKTDGSAVHFYKFYKFYKFIHNLYIIYTFYKFIHFYKFKNL